jgi:hypothetical protein
MAATRQWKATKISSIDAVLCTVPSVPQGVLYVLSWNRGGNCDATAYAIAIVRSLLASPRRRSHTRPLTRRRPQQRLTPPRRGLPAVRGGHDRRPGPLGAPSDLGHDRLRHLMRTTMSRHDRRPRRRGRPRVRSGVPRPGVPARDLGPRVRTRHLPGACRRRSRADGPSIADRPCTGIQLPDP